MAKKSKTKTKKKTLPVSQPQQNRTDAPRALATATAETFSGPLPHPQILKKYNEVVPEKVTLQGANPYPTISMNIHCPNSK